MTPERGQWQTMADRCEAATGPDRELDQLIGAAMGHPGKPRNIYKRNHYTRNGPVLLRVETEYPRFTVSLDAAMTLVPTWLTPTIIGHDREVRLLNGIGLKVGGADHCSVAVTLPLALCAAALRAKAMEAGTVETERLDPQDDSAVPLGICPDLNDLNALPLARGE